MLDVDLPEGISLINSRYGPMMYLTGDAGVGRWLEVCGEWSEGELILLRQFIQPGDTIVDVGANIGSHTVALAQATGPLGRVIAIEAQRFISQVLAGNVALNGLANVIVCNVAVGRQGGTVDVPVFNYKGPDQNYATISFRDDWHGPKSPLTEPVVMTTLDALLGERRVALLKLDIEGMEPDAIRGAHAFLMRDRPPIYLECENNFAEVAGVLADLDYLAWWHVVPASRPDNPKRYIESNPVLLKLCSHNILALPKGHPKCDALGLAPFSVSNPPTNIPLAYGVENAFLETDATGAVRLVV